MVCMFEGPNLPSSVNGAIPTFGVNPSNTNFLAATGVFTNKKEGICTFPKTFTGNADGENTITPYVMGNFVTRGVTARDTLRCKGLNGAKTYTSFQCPQITYNRMAEGEFTLYFAAPTGPQFLPYVFAVSSPTTATDYVYQTAIASTTLAPVPATTSFTTQISGTSTITITVSPEPSATLTDTVFSATIPITVFETSAEQIHTIFESSITTNVVSMAGVPSSTTTETEYTDTTVTTEYSTATIVMATTVTEFIESCSSDLVSDPTLTTTATHTNTSTFSTETITNTGTSPPATEPTPSQLAQTSTGTEISSSFDSTSTTPSTSTGTINHSIETITSSGTSALTTPARPTPPVCPGSDGSSFALSNGASFTVKCHRDYQVGQMGAVYTQSFEGCMSSCSRTLGCKAVAYTGGSMAGWCYLKNQGADAEDVDGVWGAVLTAEATQTAEPSASSYTASATASAVPTLSCPSSDKASYMAKDGSAYTIECYTDHHAGDIGMTYEPDLDGCIEACASRDDCVDVAWVPGSPGPCYLKGEVGASIANQGVWGAIKATSSAPSPTAAASATPTTPAVCPKGMVSPAKPISCPAHDGACFETTDNDVFEIECFSDRADGDLALSWETSFPACLEKCARTAGCIDVSYAHGAGACYMKSAANAIARNRDVYGARKLVDPAAAASATAPITTTIPKRRDARARPTTLLLLSVAPRAQKTDPAGFDYTYPWTLRTTVTATAATRVVTVTPAPAGSTISTVLSQATRTVAVTPAPSGVATRTVTTESTSTTTATTLLLISGPVKTVTTGVVYSTAVETAVAGPANGVATVTVRTASVETTRVTTSSTVTVAGGTVTVRETGCTGATPPTTSIV